MILDEEWAELNTDQREWLSEACHEALTNEAPEAARYEVTGSFEPYPVLIRDVPGAYFTEALESDPLGPFATLELSKDGVELNYWGSAQPKSGDQFS